MNNILNNDNEKAILKNRPIITKINDNNFVSIAEYEERIGVYYDVVFHNEDQEFFIGRYIKTFDSIKAMYNNGKIMVYTDKFDSKLGNFFVTKVRTLYDILDDTFYSMTEKEALVHFNPDLDPSYLKNPNQLIVREDLEKLKVYTK